MSSPGSHATGRPTARPRFTVQRCLPFLAVLVVAALSPALPHDITPTAKWWSLAWALIAVLIGGCFVAARKPAGHWTQTAAPLIAIPVVQALRAADGNAVSGFSPLLFLPVVFFALYGRRRDLIIALTGSLIVEVVPPVLIGAPSYPSSAVRGSLLLFVVLVATGILVSRLVESSRQATTSLSVSETRFRAAFDDAPVGMSLTGVSGPDTGYFLRVNRALCALLGRSADELTGRPIESFTHPDDRAATGRLFATAADSHTSHRVEKRYVHSSGRIIWAAVSYSVVRDDTGRALHMVCQVEDVSARRESDKTLLDALETERVAAERMREVDQMRNELVSGVAHDLRTPLTSAAGFTELLSDETVGPLNREQHTLLDTVSRSLTRLAGMVDELLATARRDLDRSRPSALAAVDVDSLVDGAIQATAMLAAAKQQRVSCSGVVNGARVRGDANRLDRALVNLVGNAVKFTPDGGTIAVETSATDDEVVIRVSDTGIGIAAVDQQKIFERFYRSADVVDKAISGTGLGLAIVKEIVTQHGGAIHVDSRPGEGATFTLRLPMLTGS